MSLIKQDFYDRNPEKGLKSIAGVNTIIHCHHYNSRLQKTIEGNKKIEGQKIIRECSAVVYCNLLKEIVQKKSLNQEFKVAEDVYSFLGFGRLDFSEEKVGIVTSPSSHFVQGWKCGAVQNSGKVCRMTEGYIEASFKALKNQNVKVEETECMNEEGVTCCKFKITQLDNPQYDYKLSKIKKPELKINNTDSVTSSNIDKDLVIKTVLNLPLEGNNEGLIPAFNVYLAHTPQDFYNLISIKFLQEMTKIGLKTVATDMLTEDAENCALNTFGGILDSDEWSALIKPMIKDDKDIMYGLIAVANALGWGRINIKELTEYKSLILTSSNGYEAYGNLEFKEPSSEAQCFMLKGVSAGLMGLVYSKGDLDDRAGLYVSDETSCLVKEDHICEFSVRIAE